MLAYFNYIVLDSTLLAFKPWYEINHQTQLLRYYHHCPQFTVVFLSVYVKSFFFAAHTVIKVCFKWD